MKVGGRKTGRLETNQPSIFPFLHSSILLALILLATWLRLWRLETIPPGLWFDESLNGMEAVWMLRTNDWPIFIRQGQGREVMFHYLVALSISVLGETVYAIRLVPALLGIVSIPLMYRWNLTLLRDRPAARWLAMLSTAGLVVSFDYLVMNRVGYRANTLLPWLLLTYLFFWQAWRTGQGRYYLLTGLALGLCQYTYLAGRLAPFVLIVFALLQSLLGRNDLAQLKRLWGGLAVTMGVALLVVMPMLLFFRDYPELFWERGSDVTVEVDWTATGPSSLGEQVGQALRVFWDGQDPNWRHHLLGRPGFDQWGSLAFLIGLGVVGWRYRRPSHLFLLSMLGVMWLPALLTDPAFHTLRLLGILPPYYVLLALGLGATWQGIGRLGAKMRSGSMAGRWLAPDAVWGSLSIAVIVLVSGGVTVRDYFERWANHAEVYHAFDGPVVALAERLTTTTEVNVVIPFYLYTHASLRYLLHARFQETVFLPEPVAHQLQQRPDLTLLIPAYPPADGQPPAWVWLVKTAGQPGQAYVSAVVREEPDPDWLASPAEPVMNDRGDIIAQSYTLEPSELLPLFITELPQKQSEVIWGDNLKLSGYEFRPAVIQPTETAQLYLAWEILGYTSLPGKMFLQFLDSQGHGVGQAEIEPISRKMYRWRDDGLVFELHPFQTGRELQPGLYFVRLGFFEPDTGRRLLATGSVGQPLGDAVIVGPLYVAAPGSDPTQPEQPLAARLGDEFELLGYSVYTSSLENSVEVQLYWQALRPVEIDYTAFVQLLDEDNQVMAQADAQPLADLYPTSRWQPGDLMSDRFTLPVSPADLGQGRLVTGLYDVANGVRLSAYDGQGNLLADGFIELLEE